MKSASSKHNNGWEKPWQHNVSKPWICLIPPRPINQTYIYISTYLLWIPDSGFPDREKITNKAIAINPRLGLGSHVAGVMVEAHGRCAAVLVQDLFAEATARRVVLGDHVIRCRLATKLRASQGAPLVTRRARGAPCGARLAWARSRWNQVAQKCQKNIQSARINWINILFNYRFVLLQKLYSTILLWLWIFSYGSSSGMRAGVIHVSGICRFLSGPYFQSRSHSIHWLSCQSNHSKSLFAHILPHVLQPPTACFFTTCNLPPSAFGKGIIGGMILSLAEVLGSNGTILPFEGARTHLWRVVVHTSAKVKPLGRWKNMSPKMVNQDQPYWWKRCLRHIFPLEIWVWNKGTMLIGTIAHQKPVKTCWFQRATVFYWTNMKHD